MAENLQKAIERLEAGMDWINALDHTLLISADIRTVLDALREKEECAEKAEAAIVKHLASPHCHVGSDDLDEVLRRRDRG